MKTVKSLWTLTTQISVGIIFSLTAMVASSAFAEGEMRVKYALAFGDHEGPVERFVPGHAFLPSNFVMRANFAVKNLQNVPAEFSSCSNLFSKFAYPAVYSANGINVQGMVSVVLDKLRNDVIYTLRVVCFEPYHAFTSGNQRVFSISVNGEVKKDNCDAYTDSGGLYTPVCYELACTADEDGVITINIENVINKFALVGLELLEPAGNPHDPPNLIVNGFKEFVHLVPEMRSNAFRYDIQYRDGEEGTDVKTFASGVDISALYDIAPAVDGVTRYYRARVAEEGNNVWSEWIAADRTVSATRILRMNSYGSENFAEIEGWEDQDVYCYPQVNRDAWKGKNSAQDIDVSFVTNPAPQDIYKTGGYIENNGARGYLFPRMNPLCAYRLRIHLAETYAKCDIGFRMFQLASNGFIVEDWNHPQIDEYGTIDIKKYCNESCFVAGVLERDITTLPDGSINVGIFKLKDNPIVRGIELIPTGVDYFSRAGFNTVFHRNASDEDASAENEEAVEGVLNKTELTWRSSDIPAACTGDGAPARILSSGRVLISRDVDGGALTVTGTGIVNFYMDGNAIRAHLNADGTGGSTTFSAKAGVYDFYVEQLQKSGTDFSSEIKITDREGNEIPVAMYQSALTPEVAPWKFHRLHGYNNSETKSPSYPLPLNEERTSFRVYGSGNDTYTSTDTGSILYQKAPRQFQITMRTFGVGGGYVEGTRFGFGFRGGLGRAASDKFMSVIGFRVYDAQTRYIAYYDFDLSNGASHEYPASMPYVDGDVSKNLWMRLTKINGAAGKSVVTMEYSTDGATWIREYTFTDVPRTEFNYVGPMVVAHNKAETSLPWMDVDNLEIVDLTPKGMIIIVR